MKIVVLRQVFQNRFKCGWYRVSHFSFHERNRWQREIWIYSTLWLWTITSILDVSTLIIKAAGFLQCQHILMRLHGAISMDVLIFVVTSPTAVYLASSLFCITQAQINPIGFPTSRIVGYSADVAMSSSVILLARLLVDIMNQLFSTHWSNL